jgi:hypothetical protein
MIKFSFVFKLAVLAILIHPLFVSCGQAVVALGGIVDNGNKPPPPKPGNADSGSQVDPAPFVASSLFHGRHTIRLPQGYQTSLETADHQEFSHVDLKPLIFDIVKAPCAAGVAYVTSNNAKIYDCSPGVVQMEVMNADIVQLRHDLDEANLHASLDSFL